MRKFQSNKVFTLIGLAFLYPNFSFCADWGHLKDFYVHTINVDVGGISIFEKESCRKLDSFAKKEYVEKNCKEAMFRFFCVEASSASYVALIFPTKKECDDSIEKLKLPIRRK